jgi:tetratricopeptide (TPR) repeat protein
MMMPYGLIVVALNLLLALPWIRGLAFKVLKPLQSKPAKVLSTEDLKRLESYKQELNKPLPYLSELTDDAKYFLAYAERGQSKFKLGDLEGAYRDFKLAEKANPSMILPQLGILMYTLGMYEDAHRYLNYTIFKTEENMDYRASDLRMWKSASLNQLNRTREAKLAIEENLCYGDIIDTMRYAMNLTMHLYSGTCNIDNILPYLTAEDDDDQDGSIFYASFYCGLYFDSIHEPIEASRLLCYSAKSNRFRPDDLWHHLPRFLFKKYEKLHAADTSYQEAIIQKSNEEGARTRLMEELERFTR